MLLEELLMSRNGWTGFARACRRTSRACLASGIGVGNG